jgi:hypothetical protein
MTRRGAAVRAPVDEIRDYLGTNDGLALVRLPELLENADADHIPQL